MAEIIRPNVVFSSGIEVLSLGIPIVYVTMK